MDINPQRVRTAEFATARKGLDPVEVRDFLGQVADELEQAQNQATAMEARARAAVARLQQLSDEADVSGEVAAPPTSAESAPMSAEPAGAAPADPVKPIVASVDESDTISRTMLLAQRAADLTVAEAEAEAARLRSEANGAATALVEQARSDARSAGDAERQVVEGEVNALMARRDFLEGDVDQMERFMVDQRMRLREAATAMIDVAERVPGGLGDVRRPLLSASDDDEPLEPTMAYERPVDAPGDDEAEPANDAGAVVGAEGAGEADATAERLVDVVDDDDTAEPPPVMRLGFDET